MREAEEILRLVGAGLLPCIAYTCVGLRLVPRVVPQAEGLERWGWSWLLGTGVCSLGILALRGIGVPVPLLAAGIVVAALWPRRTAGATVDAAPERGWLGRLEAAAAAFGALLVAAALAPETYWDGFEYHLPLIAAWTEGPIRALPGMIDAEFRAGVDLLYVPAVTSGFADAAAAVSAVFALALAALVRAEATRRAGAVAGGAAAALLLTTPLVVELAPSTYVDLAVGAYGFGALLAVDRWNRGGPARELTLAALCLGFAANAKLNAAALLPAAALLAWLGGRVPPLRLQLRAAAWVGLIVTPWLAKTWLTSGNPVFPLLGAWLGHGAADPAYFGLRAFRGAANYPVARDLAGFGQYLASLTFGRNVHVSGLLGPLPLALAPLALSRRPGRPTLALLGVGALLLVLLFASLPAARFGTPLWALLAVAAAVGGARLAGTGAWSRRLLVGLLVLVGLHQALLAAVELLPRVAALRRPDAYRLARFPEQVSLQRMVALGEPVVGIPMGAVAWMPAPVYNLLWERNGELYFTRGTPPATPPAAALALLRERDVRSLVVDVEPPHPADGRTGHPIVDAWLEAGDVALAPDVEPLPARAGRRWVLVRLVTRSRQEIAR